MDNHGQEHGNNVNHTSSFFAGMLMGGLAGAAVMLLFAPQSGEKTRARIQQKGIELRDHATSSIESAEDAVAQVRVKARRVTADVRHKTKELQKHGQEMFDEQKERLSTLVETR